MLFSKMAEKKELRQAENVAKIEGIVEEVKIENKKVNGKDAIAGEIDIRVGEDVHSVNVFSYKYKKDSDDESGLYQPLVTVMNEYKSIKNHGKDEADKVRITQGQIGLNDYYGQDGKLRSFPQLSTNFINRITDDEFEPKAQFTLEMYVRNVVEEIKNEEETGRAILKGYVPVYGNKVIPFEVIVEGEQAVNYVTDNYEKGTTVTIHGDIINKKIVTEKVIEAEFGENKVDTTITTIREYLVKGGSAPRDEDDSKAYKWDEIKEGLKEREKMLADKKVKAEEKNGGSSSSSDPFSDDNGGFGKPVDISDDDLPF